MTKRVKEGHGRMERPRMDSIFIFTLDLTAVTENSCSLLNSTPTDVMFLGEYLSSNSFNMRFRVGAKGELARSV